MITDCLSESSEDLLKFQSKYTKYSFLWDEEITEKFNEFLENKELYDKKDIVVEEEEEEEAVCNRNPILNNVIDKMPSLIHFEEKIL